MGSSWPKRPNFYGLASQIQDEEKGMACGGRKESRPSAESRHVAEGSIADATLCSCPLVVQLARDCKRGEFRFVAHGAKVASVRVRISNREYGKKPRNNTPPSDALYCARTHLHCLHLSVQGLSNLRVQVSSSFH